jgi:hypothetical protein
MNSISWFLTDDSQNGWSCLLLAALMMNLKIIKYLCEVGGKELMMLQNKVWPIFT